MEVYLLTPVKYNNETYTVGEIYDFPEAVAKRLIEVKSAKPPSEVKELNAGKGVVAKVIYENQQKRFKKLLDELTVKTLRKLASKKEIKNYANLNKEELIAELIKVE